MSSDGPLDQEISHRIQSGWRNWKNVSGVLWLKNACENEGKNCLNNNNEQGRIRREDDVVEMRRTCWVTGFDRISNGWILEISRKKYMFECMKATVMWLRREKEYAGKISNDVERKRWRGWRDCLQTDFREKGITGEQ